ncbi:alpha/beta hydrolase [Siphonobacter sp. SORGH_AS_1065]|uniref:alpha/beta hydrolase family protein n=1 Tax=Siphonobacter sp. SORGH_AS_1065 TaxID=3041795 RepID=UPI00277F6FF9|nr:alpha/beta hydrolase [Siphonobacter sp. SORGH_AS_1065]MDQ1087314.1 pimeloyl-ACP methyl ester carboxylesterase [Siphonobacter sp. SORGH_AS_1065]
MAIRILFLILYLEMRYFIIALTLFIFAQCSKQRPFIKTTKNVQLDTLTLFDTSRNRSIPIAIYQPKSNLNGIPIIFSHGYGQNKGGAYLEYSYLTEFLASKGYFIISVQHELPTDSLLPSTGKPQLVRRSNWERGVQNIHFVLQEMKTKYPTLNYAKLALMGHSNGGDMTALFAHLYPDFVSKVITLDNRRMGLPRTSKPQLFTLRSADYPADDGVLPTDTEAQQLGIRIQFTPIKHNDMDNDARPTEREYIQNRVLAYLRK